MQNVFISRKNEAPNKPNNKTKAPMPSRKSIKKLVNKHYTLKKSKVILKNMPDGGRINDLTAVFIKKALNKSIARNKIAEYLNIDINIVQGIVYGRSYKNLEPALSQEAIQKARSRNYKAATKKKRAENKQVTHSVINEEIALHIKRELAKGVFARKIAEELEIDVSIIFCISSGRTWKHVQLEPGEAERLWEENAEERDIAAAELIAAKTRNTPVGSKSGRSKLNESSAADIKREILAGASFSKLGEKYGVSVDTISNIANYKNWKHVRLSDDEETALAAMDFTARFSNPGESAGNAKLTDAKVLGIKRGLLNGATFARLAEQYGIGISTVARIKSGDSWAHVRLSDQEEEALAAMDVREKRRQAKLDSAAAVFTDEQVLEIKYKLLSGAKITGADGLAAEYGVGATVIKGIKYSKTWTHVRMSDIDEARLAAMHKGTLDTETVLSVKQGLRDGKTARQLAKKFGISKSTVYSIKAGNAYADIKLPREPYVNMRELYESLRLIYDNPVDRSGIKLITHSYDSRYNNSGRPNYFGGEGVFGVVYYKEFYLTERDDAGNEAETLAGRYIGSRYAGPLKGYATSSKPILRWLKSHDPADIRIETSILRKCYAKKELLRWEDYYQRSHKAVEDPAFFNQVYALDLYRNGRTKEGIRELARDHYTFKDSKVVIRNEPTINTITAAFIKRALNRGIIPAKIAGYLQISEGIIKTILRGTTWTGVKPDLLPEAKREIAEKEAELTRQRLKGTRAGVGNSNSKLRESDVIFIKKCLLMGLTGTKIAAHMNNRKIGRPVNVHESVIYSIKSGEQWGHVQLPPDVEALYASRYKDWPRFTSKETREKMSKALKGKYVGEDSGNAILKNADVVCIKQELLKGRNYAELAEKFGVGEGTIAHIKNGVSWTHVRLSDTEEEELTAMDRREMSIQEGLYSGNPKLDVEQVLEIKRALLAGEKSIALAEQYGVSRSVIISIRDGESWKHVRLSDKEEQQLAETDFKEMHKVKGEDCHAAKLTDEIVREIKHELLAGAEVSELAARHGVVDGVVHSLRSGKTWKHVRLSDADEARLAELAKRGKLTDAQALEIKRKLLAGETIDDLAEQYGVSKATITNLKNGKSYPHIRLSDEDEARLAAIDRRTENGRSGADNPAAKLNETIVLQIRRDLLAGLRPKGEIDVKYGIHFATVHNIKNGSAWPQVRMTDAEEAQLAAMNNKLNEAKVLEIKREIRNGATSKAVAEKFGVHLATIARIRQGKAWKHVQLPEDETPSTINTTG